MIDNLETAKVCFLPITRNRLDLRKTKTVLALYDK